MNVRDTVSHCVAANLGYIVALLSYGKYNAGHFVIDVLIFACAVWLWRRN